MKRLISAILTIVMAVCMVACSSGKGNIDQQTHISKLNSLGFVKLDEYFDMITTISGADVQEGSFYYTSHSADEAESLYSLFLTNDAAYTAHPIGTILAFYNQGGQSFYSGLLVFNSEDEAKALFTLLSVDMQTYSQTSESYSCNSGNVDGYDYSIFAVAEGSTSMATVPAVYCQDDKVFLIFYNSNGSAAPASWEEMITGMNLKSPF
ncbi:MAG: hypothetical protein MJ103_09005 [Saccharofermentans sp.]|nr:hypothetical protein [Saccharofermentans sp.]